MSSATNTSLPGAQCPTLSPSTSCEKNLAKGTSVPIVLGLSPGNPFYYKDENLARLFKFANNYSDEVKLFITDVIMEHNYRAVKSSNPERAARVKANRLRNKCQAVLKAQPGVDHTNKKFTYIDWRAEVETSNAYQKQLEYIMDLFNTHEQLRSEVLDVTAAALQCLCNGRKGTEKENKATNKQKVNSDGHSHPGSEIKHHKDNDQEVISNVPLEQQQQEDNNKHGLAGRPVLSESIPQGSFPQNKASKAANTDTSEIDVAEGSNYLLKELAFFMALPEIYNGFENYVFVYHREWPVLENLFAGVYDGIVRPCLHFVILDQAEKCNAD